MRRSIKAGMLALLGWIAVGTTPAASEIWCIRDFNRASRTCAFPNGQDCFRAVAITGGVCERQSAVPEKRSGNKPEPREWRFSGRD